MATNAELAISYREHDARVLDEAARIVRRRLKKPAGISTALFARTLLIEADRLRSEARALADPEGYQP